MKGNGLRRLRLARGLSAAQLAEAVGATEAEVLRWEADELPPSDKLLALSAALGAEGVGKDVNMMIGNGYTKGHANVALQILREDEKIRNLFAELYA